MSDEHNIVVGDLEIELISIQADINDDDEEERGPLAKELAGLSH